MITAKQFKLEEFTEFEVPNITSNQTLTKICENEFQRLKSKPTKEIVEAEFYPYSNLKLTIRERKGKIMIRMSDILSDASRKVLASAANRIISQYLNRKPDHEAKAIYDEYIHSELMNKRTTCIRQARAGKRLTEPKGKYHDLDEYFNKIHDKYFNSKLNSKLTKPTLSWSERKSKFRIGHYDSDLDTLVVSRHLDTKKTPRYVVEYVVFHELLHKLHPGRFVNGRRQIHTREFKQDEKLFEELSLATKWIKQK